MSDPWYVYVIECSDGSLYTGVARDVDKRISEHNSGKGGKYTRGRYPVRLLASSEPLDKVSAYQLESRVKKLRGPDKLDAVSHA